MLKIAGIILAVITATVVIVFAVFTAEESTSSKSESTQSGQKDVVATNYLHACPLSDGFVFPVGPPEARGYYNAQPFGQNNHLGEDWNGKGGGNSDLGDSIHAISRGIVFYVGDPGPGWGNVVRLLHNIGSTEEPRFVESLYGHLKTVEVSSGDIVGKGQRLGTMGNVEGLYYAHLHLEVRTNISMSIGGGYSRNRDGYADPTKFIRSHTAVSR